MRIVRDKLKRTKQGSPLGKILVTAGPTIEPLDPIRFLSNHSTGTMGFAIAAEARGKGFDVCLVSGPVHLAAPEGVERVNVQTARQMRDAVAERIEEYDCLIMTAAVCDFRPEKEASQKIKKQETLTLKLIRNPDILSEAAREENLVRVGFALETETPIQNAKKKLKGKNLDLIIVNTKNTETDPFGPGAKQYTIIDAKANVRDIKDMNKTQLAGIIIEEVGKLLQ
ncbi:phosphopantothenoylcysteine decarboxylase [Candidatus Omnitrophota bacterium]